MSSSLLSILLILSVLRLPSITLFFCTHPFTPFMYTHIKTVLVLLFLKILHPPINIKLISSICPSSLILTVVRQPSSNLHCGPSTYLQNHCSPPPIHIAVLHPSTFLQLILPPPPQSDITASYSYVFPFLLVTIFTSYSLSLHLQVSARLHIWVPLVFVSESARLHIWVRSSSYLSSARLRIWLRSSSYLSPLVFISEFRSSSYLTPLVFISEFRSSSYLSSACLRIWVRSSSYLSSARLRISLRSSSYLSSARLHI